MFNKGQLAGLMKQAQAMQDNLKKAQDELAFIEVTGESGAGLAIRRRGEVPPGQSGEVCGGRIAVEDLEHEQVDRRDRVEEVLPPGVTNLFAQGAKGVR